MLNLGHLSPQITWYPHAYLCGLSGPILQFFWKIEGVSKVMVSRSLIYFHKTQVITRLKNFGFFFLSQVLYFMNYSQVLLQTAFARKFVFTLITVKNLNFLFHVLLKCFFRLPTLGNSFLHFSQLKTWVSCFMFILLCFSRFQGAANSFSHVSHWNRIWKHWLRKTKCIAQEFSTTIIHISQEIFMS